MSLKAKTEFSKILTSVAELYGKTLSPCLFQLYWSSLERYSLEEIKHALSLHIVNPDVGQFMPKPADIVRYLEGKTQEKVLLAWEKIIYAIRNTGAYESVSFDDVLINYVIEKMGGWISLCHSIESKLPFLFQDFSRHYQFGLIRPVFDYPKKLAGIFEHLNNLAGYTSNLIITEGGKHENTHEVKVIKKTDEDESNSGAAGILSAT